MTERIVPDNFCDPQFRVSKDKPCPICGKPDWCLSDQEQWALCNRVESPQRWKDAGWFHRLGANVKDLGGPDGIPMAPSTAQDTARNTSQPRISEAKEVHTLWKSQAEADQIFEGLRPVADNPERLQFFANEYSLAIEWIPSNWRLFNHSEYGPGVVYRVHDSAGAPAYHYKSFARDPKKHKRSSRWLWGGDGAVHLSHGDIHPLAVTHGQEKGIALFAAGYDVLSFSSGENPLSDEWIKHVAKLNPMRIVLADDADERGRQSNTGTAQALEAAGYSKSKICIVCWPEDAPAGFDINNVLGEKGLEGLRMLVDDAKPLPADPTAPQAKSLRDFLTVKRPPIAWHIERILPPRGKVTISAPEKCHKTFLVQELGICLASGNCEWLGLRFGAPVRVMMLQPELSDEMMSERSEWIIQTAPDFIDRDRALDNFILMETAQGRPNLAARDGQENTEGRKRVETLIKRFSPQVLIIDPLYMTFVGLDENTAGEMSLALDYLARLTIRYNLAIVLSHHFGKAGTTRGSSVFGGWGDSDFKMSPLKTKPEIVRVTGQFRCRGNDGFPAFWQRPASSEAWFHEMPQDCDAPIIEKIAGYEKVLAVLSDQVPRSWTQLKMDLQQRLKCGERTAEKLIKEAVESGKVTKNDKFYVIAK
ncbi:MAG: AAA family ATPase [Candidatus Sumerlaeota bacterium]|nr:AAA family ATPase [Candidatus Sumerlaeota bacterium]